eukprot:m.50708 g.50708  ORF g.50708 m.50708 type:complete len:84 (-) comp6558_c0_seq1:75-326(-)
MIRLFSSSCFVDFQPLFVLCRVFFSHWQRMALVASARGAFVFSCFHAPYPPARCGDEPAVQLVLLVFFAFLFSVFRVISLHLC